MIQLSRRALLASALLPLGAAVAPARAQTAAAPADFGKVAAPIFSALAKTHGIPGLVVGITRNGQHEILAIGQTARTDGRPVDGDTLFELGSVSKTFNVTLAALAAERGRLDLNAPLDKVAQRLTGTAFGALTPLDLATHATGGMPLQVPDSVRHETELVEWLAAWKPAAPPATRRAYSNISIGVLGLVTATALGTSRDRPVSGPRPQQHLYRRAGSGDGALRHGLHLGGQADPGDAGRAGAGSLWGEIHRDRHAHLPRRQYGCRQGGA